jgi:hypothetical protein
LPVLGEEALDFFGFDKRKVLPRMHSDSEVPISNWSEACLDGDALALHLRSAALRAYEDSFDDHCVSSDA